MEYCFWIYFEVFSRNLKMVCLCSHYSSTQSSFFKCPFSEEQLVSRKKKNVFKAVSLYHSHKFTDRQPPLAHRSTNKATVKLWNRSNSLPTGCTSLICVKNRSFTMNYNVASNGTPICQSHWKILCCTVGCGAAGGWVQLQFFQTGPVLSDSSHFWPKTKKRSFPSHSVSLWCF